MRLAVPARGDLPGHRGHAALSGRAVRAAGSDHAVRRYRDRARLRDQFGTWPAGQHFQLRPGQDRRIDRPAGQSGLAGQHQLPVPARARRIPVYRTRFRRGHLVGQRRAAMFASTASISFFLSSIQMAILSCTLTVLGFSIFSFRSCICASRREI